VPPPRTTPNALWPIRTAFLVATLGLFAGCAVSHKTAVKPPAVAPLLLTATKQDLIARYNAAASSITSLDATTTLQLTAGSSYTGVIEQYHEVKAFILASRPANIRMVGQAPIVGKNIFDMASDGQSFEIFIPSKNEFLTGPTNFERKASKPIENLRPQHLIGALFWPSIPAGSIVLMEESSDATPAYVLTVATRSTAAGSDDWRIVLKISFERTNLTISRIQTLSEEGAIISDVQLGHWQLSGATSYPREISLSRPADDYHLRISLTKLSLNQPIEADKFQLTQPEGSRLVRVGPDVPESQP